jgi:DNA polymerase/3'-5' exonuclease PolX
MGTAKVELEEARKLAESIRAHITPAMARCEVAGSVRREKPEVGDIELVGLPADGELLCRLLSEVGQPIKPGVPGVVPWPLKPDAKYMRLHLPELGCNLDLFNAHELNWGGLLLMRTGSGVDPRGNAFNGFTPGCFSRWKKLSGGGRMVGCQPQRPDGELLPLREEADFFDLLGLDFIPPPRRLSRAVIKEYVR